MKLKHFHDFADDDRYPLPYVLVYRGTEPELMDVGVHCKMYVKGQFSASELMQVDNREWIQTFHFEKKAEAMFCKLCNDV